VDPERAEENGIKFIAQHFDGARRSDTLRANTFPRSSQTRQTRAAAWQARHCFQHLHGLRRDLFPNTVAGMTAIRAAAPPSRIGMPTKSCLLDSRFAPSNELLR